MNLKIMNYKNKKKTVLTNVENAGVKQIDIRISYGDEIAVVSYVDGRTETHDSCPDGEYRTDGKIDGRYTLYTPGNPWPGKWDKRKSAYDGQRMMKEG